MKRTSMMLLLTSIFWSACRDKPTSKTTVHTETTVEGKAGEKTTTDTKEVETEMPDGTKQSQHTETVTTKPEHPKAAPSPFVRAPN